MRGVSVSKIPDGHTVCKPVQMRVFTPDAQDGDTKRTDANAGRGQGIEKPCPIYSAIAARLAQIGMRLAAEGKLKQTSP
jgi:hypothetical protein